MVLPLPILAVGLLSRRRWLPRFSRHATRRLLSVGVLYASATLYWLPQSAAGSAGVAVLSRWLGGRALPDPVSANALVAVAVLIVAVAANLFWDSVAISRPTADPEAGAPLLDRAFSASLERYCTALVAELDRYDRDVNWSDRELTPLEAEVETERSGRLRPRIARDLVQAIRSDRESGVFLVLGDPGSGKSVSLRRLVRVFCDQAEETGIVPVYVNLREYPDNAEPETESLLAFVRKTSFDQAGRDGRAFLDSWYEACRRSGRLFFVIDSFDEMPCVLDSDDKSETHRRISATFDRFFTQEIQGCRAVLASRHFRAPVGVGGTRLVVRPFTERQIRAAMRTWLAGRGIEPDAYIRRLFTERPHLVPLLRNPFTAELIAEFAIFHGQARLPGSLYDVFDHYLMHRLEGDRPALAERGLTPQEVREAAGAIATAMYEAPRGGLEVETARVLPPLEEAFDGKAESLLEALRYTRLARTGGRDRRLFSFVHRRFAEFFVVDEMRRREQELPIEAIPTDSRWRDCLVMYCGIADVAARRRIAQYCWSVIEAARDQIASGSPEGRRAVHCIRFLADAFRADAEALSDLRAPLGWIVARLLRSDDLLVAKIAAEMIPLAKEASQQVAVVSALGTHSPWVCDTALNACRHLGQLAEDTNWAIRGYVRRMTTFDLLRRFSDLSFSFGLSDAFRGQRRALAFDMAEAIGVPLTAIVLCSVVVARRSGALPLLLVLPTFLVMAAGQTGRIPDIERYVTAAGGLFSLWARSLLYCAGVDLASGGFLTRQGSHLPPALGLTVGVANAIGLGLFGVLRWDACFAAFTKRWRQRVAVSIGQREWSFLAFPLRKGGARPTLLLAAVALAFYLLARVGWLGIALAVVLTPAVALGVALTLYHGPYRTCLAALECRRVRVRGFPSSVGCDELYDTLLALRTARARREYLSGLRRGRTRLEGEVVPPPSELVEDPLVAEGLAQLREQWLGLAN